MQLLRFKGLSPALQGVHVEQPNVDEVGAVLSHPLGLTLSALCRQFTLNMISNWFVEAANFTCTPFEHGVDELDFVGLTPIPSQKVGCELHCGGPSELYKQFAQQNEMGHGGATPTAIDKLGYSELQCAVAAATCVSSIVGQSARPAWWGQTIDASWRG